MDNEKIVITVDECNNVTPHGSSASWQPSTECGEPEDRKTGKKVFFAVLITSLVFATAGMVIYCVTRNGSGDRQGLFARQPKTVGQFRDEFIDETNEMLKDPNANVRKYIEDAHITVTVSQAYVTNCSVMTIDGSDLAGDDDSNISEIDVTIRFYWDGIIDSGHTDLKVAIDYRADKVISSEIVYTDALVNTSDPLFWIGLGSLLFL